MNYKTRSFIWKQRFKGFSYWAGDYWYNNKDEIKFNSFVIAVLAFAGTLIFFGVSVSIDIYDEYQLPYKDKRYIKYMEILQDATEQTQ